ncbi:MAG: META domain-containing protein [Bacteroidetes bacterium]|nr:MAG: META domain-containing protein [Bacteroidota bacterium]
MTTAHNLYKFAFAVCLFTLAMACSGTRQAKSAAAPKLNLPLAGTYWRLTELMGKPVSVTKGAKKQLAITLGADGGRAFGFSGCNMFNGSYTIGEGSSIVFSRTAATMMACADMETERRFLEVLNTADAYSIVGNTLVLSKARVAPLAKFVADTKP